MSDQIIRNYPTQSGLNALERYLWFRYLQMMQMMHQKMPGFLDMNLMYNQGNTRGNFGIIPPFPDISLSKLAAGI